MRGHPLGVVEKAGAYFSSGIVDVGVKNAGEASHLRKNMRRENGLNVPGKTTEHQSHFMRRENEGRRGGRDLGRDGVVIIRKHYVKLQQMVRLTYCDSVL